MLLMCFKGINGCNSHSVRGRVNDKASDFGITVTIRVVPVVVAAAQLPMCSRCPCRHCSVSITVPPFHSYFSLRIAVGDCCCYRRASHQWCYSLTASVPTAAGTITSAPSCPFPPSYFLCYLCSVMTHPVFLGYHLQLLKCTPGPSCSPQRGLLSMKHRIFDLEREINNTRN